MSNLIPNNEPSNIEEILYRTCDSKADTSSRSEKLKKNISKLAFLKRMKIQWTDDEVAKLVADPKKMYSVPRDGEHMSGQVDMRRYV